MGKDIITLTQRPHIFYLKNGYKNIPVLRNDRGPQLQKDKGGREGRGRGGSFSQLKRITVSDPPPPLPSCVLWPENSIHLHTMK